MDRAELLQRIAAGRAELDDALAAIPEDRMESVGPDGTWSPKDQLSHLAAWHEIVLARLRSGVEEDEVDLPDGYADMEIDDVNRFLFQRDRNRTVAQAREALDRTYAEVTARLEALPEEALHRTFRPELPNRVLFDTIVGNTYEHYEEHVPMLRRAASA